MCDKTGYETMVNILYVGIDDTDSSEGMCTTYIGAVVMDELKHRGFQVEGYPRLIRLNPFAPFKTRGNGAVAFKLKYNPKKDSDKDIDKDIDKAKQLILTCVEKLAELKHENTNPGVVFYNVEINNGEINPELNAFALKAVQDMVTIDEAQKLADQLGAEIHKFKNGRGIIGALAAIGCPLDDKTYELLAYRIPENYGKPREIDYESVFLMNKKTYPMTFDNVDEEEGYIAIEPHTPCPILYGIRGESPEVVAEAHDMVKVYEPIERTAIFVTNQHTDQHLIKVSSIAQTEKYKCYIVRGVVESSPHTTRGGHVIFSLKDDSGSIECAAYEPTKGFRDVVKELKEGDELEVYGGIGSKGTLNLEKLKILKLARIYDALNPLCQCGKRMKSAGKDKGYKCINCGAKLRDEAKDLVEVKRGLKKGFYEVPPSARRHLSKPIVRL